MSAADLPRGIASVHVLPAGHHDPGPFVGIQSLSSGERQLIAPRVLIFDEATSNLDLKSETKVEAALDILLQGRTVILIAHRLSTAMRADRIFVVADGMIVESGSHDELVARDGRYADMFQTWASHRHAA